MADKQNNANNPGQGQPTSPAGQPKPPIGQPTPPAGQPVPPAGQPKPPMGQPVPPVGQPRPPMGQPMPPVGQPRPPMGQPMPPAGQPKPPMGQPMPPQKPKKKLSRREKKELLKQQLAYEKQLIKEEKIPLRNQYRPRGFFWRTFAVSLSFIFGIFAALGGVVGAMAILLTGPSRDMLEYFNLDAERFISEAYLNKSVFDIADDVLTDINQLGDPANLTLDTFAKYSPLVDTYINDFLLTNLESIGVTLDIGELKQQTLDNLAKYARDNFLPQITLGPVLELDKEVSLQKINDNAFLYALAYGKYGVDYTLEPDTAEGADPSAMKIKMLGDSQPTNILDIIPTLAEEPAHNEDGSERSAMDFIYEIELGSLLGLDIRLPEEIDDSSIMDGGEIGQSNVMFYALCYGTEGVDYVFDDEGILQMISDKTPANLNTLINDTNGYVNALPLGEMLGLNTQKALEHKAENEEDVAAIYAICYGKEGVDYEIVETGGRLRIQEIEGGKPFLLAGDFIDEPNAVIDSLEIEALMGINADSDAAVRYIAYGNEMKKANRDVDDEGNPILKDEYGYLVDEDGNYLTEFVKNADGTDSSVLQYAGGGRYVIKTDNSDPENPVSTIVMLPDPNDPDGKPYPKKTVGSLSDEDANLLEGMVLGSVLEIDETSSGIMKAIKDWTIDDLQDQEKIESLILGDVLDLDRDAELKPDDTSNVMWAMKDWSIKDLQDQDKIESLKLNDLLGITAESSGILQAMKDWSIKDLENQNRIERLKIGTIIELGEEPSGILKAISGWRIYDLKNQEKIDSLTLADVIDIDPESPDTPEILKALHDMTLGEISTGIDTLTLEDVLGAEAFESGNLILNTLRYKQINELGDAIDALTLEDVFGNEMWSYAKDYTEDMRPVQKVEFSALTVRYYHEEADGRQTAVTEGWYTGDAETGYHKIAEGQEVIAERYIENKIYLSYTPVYYEVNYDDLDDESHIYSGSVSTDENGDFYYTKTDEAGNEVRVDLEKKDTYARLDQGELPEKYRVYTEDGDGETKYYYIEKVPVSLRYAADESGDTYGKEDVKVGYTETDTGEEVTAYHAGVWYLLLGEGTDGAETKITELGTHVTAVAAKINDLTLNEMYVHELIESEPSQDISALLEAHPIQELNGKTDLGELTINEVILLVQTIAGSLH